ncbi:MAG TPA: sugar phosphate isomerase/epimerase [Candidatus Bathyarchaeota archaeon]|nr:sugar phosphate isomerase/epimerase [Candidatus Bathyarchaeota archaeon]
MANSFRFGVTAVDFERVMGAIRSGLNFSKFNIGKLIELIYSSGFKIAELTLDMVYAAPGAFSPKNIKTLREVKESYDISYTAHLPLWSIEPASPVPHIREASVKAMAATVPLVEELEPECYVIHATGALASEFNRMKLPEDVKSVINTHFNQFALDSVNKFLELTDLEPKRVATETVEFPYLLTLELAEKLGLSVCLDTGHVLAGFPGTTDLMKVFEACSSLLGEIHLHDAWNKDGRFQDHLQLGLGDMNIELFFKKLTAIEFNGPIVLELPLEKAVKSIKLLKEKKIV